MCPGALQCVAACCSVSGRLIFENFVSFCIFQTMGGFLFYMLLYAIFSSYRYTIPKVNSLLNMLLNKHIVTRCNTLQHTATYCNTLHRTAPHCNTLQHTTTHCNSILSSELTFLKVNSLQIPNSQLAAQYVV